MEQILSMVKSAGGNLFQEGNMETKDQKESLLTVGLSTLSTSTDSNIDDLQNSSEWNETEHNEIKSHQAPYRTYFDSREKKLQEKIEFVKIVDKYKTSLFGDCDGHEVTPRSKEDAWKKVAAEIETMGLESYKGKPWARLRDHDWQYVRRHALSRNENTTRSIGKLGELDKLVLDIINCSTVSNVMNQMTSSALFLSQASTNSQSSQQSTDSSQSYWRSFLGSVTQESTDASEMGASFDDSKSSTSKIEEPVTINTNVATATPSTSGGSENILGILNKVIPHTSLSVDEALQLAASRAICTKSPVSRKITNRSATAPSVYAITSSTSSPPCSSTPPACKKARIEAERSPSVLNSSTTSPVTFEQKRDSILLKKMEAEARNIELQNEKLEKEIKIMEAQEKRNQELHNLEMRAAKARLLRGCAIDESSIDKSESNRMLVRQSNGYQV